MRGVVFHGDREVELMDFPDPEPGPGEVVVEMKASGMCGSDLHQYRRKKGGGAGGHRACRSTLEPVIVGHEPAGVIAAVGAGVERGLAHVGQRVMIHHYQGCNALRPLPVRLDPALPRRADQGVWQQRPWRPRAVLESAGEHRAAPGWRAVLRHGGRHRVRHGDRVRRAAPGQPLGQRHHRRVRPGPGRAVRHPARRRHGRAGDRARRQPRAAGARQGVRRLGDGGPALQRRRRPDTRADRRARRGRGRSTPPARPRRASPPSARPRFGAPWFAWARAATCASTSARTCCGAS